MMAQFRTALRSPDLPVVLGKMTDSGMAPEDSLRMNWGGQVQHAQQNFVEQAPCAALVSVSESFTHLDDGWHDTSADSLILGRQFAERETQLESQCHSD